MLGGFISFALLGYMAFAEGRKHYYDSDKRHSKKATEWGYYIDGKGRTRCVETNEHCIVRFCSEYCVLKGLKTKKVYRNYAKEACDIANKELEEKGAKYRIKPFYYTNVLHEFCTSYAICKIDDNKPFKIRRNLKGFIGNDIIYQWVSVELKMDKNGKFHEGKETEITKKEALELGGEFNTSTFSAFSIYRYYHPLAKRN